VDVEVGLGTTGLSFPSLRMEEESLVELRVMVDGASAAAWGTRVSYNAIHQ